MSCIFMCRGLTHRATTMGMTKAGIRHVSRTSAWCPPCLPCSVPECFGSTLHQLFPTFTRSKQVRRIVSARSPNVLAILVPVVWHTERGCCSWIVVLATDLGQRLTLDGNPSRCLANHLPLFGRPPHTSPSPPPPWTFASALGP